MKLVGTLGQNKDASEYPMIGFAVVVIGSADGDFGEHFQ